MIDMGFFINGKELMGENSSKVFNPADGSVVGTVALGCLLYTSDAADE